MGRQLVCWDSCVKEIFFDTLKNEMSHRQRSATIALARLTIAKYIKVFHNRTRMQSTLGYRALEQAPAKHLSAAAAA